MRTEDLERRSPSKRLLSREIHDISDPLCTEEPAVGLDILEVHVPLNVVLEVLPLSLSKVLPLVMRLALPVVNTQRP